MSFSKTVEGWGFSILGIETAENNEVTKIFCKTCQEGFGDITACNSDGFIDKHRNRGQKG